MAKLTYSALCSLDGYVADREGRFDWAAPDEEVHRFVNDLSRPIGTYLFGRRMYEVLVAWETMDTSGEGPVMQDYQRLWQAAEKIVYSRTLEAPSSARTRIEPEFDADAVRALKARANGDLTVGGPTLAAEALATGLVDELHLVLSPVVIGGGTAALPSGLRLDLDLRAERRFANGSVYVRYDVRP